ncbi:uncharacterized protein LOC119370086 [Jatropha curcas]|uniref:uncharacterized protein LOC119370086 n=1 Tax=Jatropha curcas TaxID=180498 RepID=UPI0005FA9C51|nr:uncharacterized protein LOC119370086 [Jatropha curcas]
MALASKNKLSFIDGSIIVPAKTDPMHSTWERCNTMVLSWITKLLSPSIAQSVLWIDIAADVWNDLQDRFSQACNCGAILTFKSYMQADYVVRFLKGLNENFSNVKTQIILIEPLPSINKVFSLVIQQEWQIAGSVEPKVLVNRVMRNYNNLGNTKSEFPKEQAEDNTIPLEEEFFIAILVLKVCSYCGRERHAIETCYRKHGFPPGFKFKNPNFSIASANAVSVEKVEKSNNFGLQPSFHTQNYHEAMLFTPEQHQKLLSLIQDQSMSNSSDHCK